MKVVLAGAAILAALSGAAARGSANLPAIAYAPPRGGDIRGVNEDGTGDRVLIAARRREALDDPAWSPDGTTLAYVGRRVGEGFTVWTTREGSRRPVLRLRGRRPETTSIAIAWSPTGRRLAAAFTTEDTTEIYVVEPNARHVRVRRLPTSGAPYAFTWRRDGRLELCLDNGAKRVTMRPDGRDLQHVGACSNRGPVWSPDGTRAALVLRDANGNGQLWLVGRHGGRVPLTNDVPIDPEMHFDYCCATWSPDGRRIAFLGNVRDSWLYDAFAFDADGTDRRRLTTSGARINPGPDALSFAPDSSTVAFSRGALHVVPAGGGTVRRVTRASTWSWSWRGRSGVAIDEPPLPAPARRRSIVLTRSSLPAWRGRLLRTRLIAKRAPLELVDQSADGTLVSFISGNGGRFGYAVGVIDVRGGAVRIVARGAAPLGWPRGGELSRDGSFVLVRRWGRVFAADVQTGALTHVADDARPSSLDWLDDGRVSFVDARGRLIAVRPGGRPRVRVALPPGSVATWSPNGRYVLYGSRCRTILLDLRTGGRRALRTPSTYEAAGPGSWSPDSRHFVAYRGQWEQGCNVLWTYTTSHATVHGTRGGQLAAVGGWSFTWSPDGNVLVATGGTKGSGVGYSQGARVVSLSQGLTAEIFDSRVDGRAFLAADGWLVHARYIATAPPESKTAVLPSRLLATQLSARWRR